MRAHEIFGEQGKDGNEGECDEIAHFGAGLGTGDHDAKQCPRRRGDGAGRSVVVEPRHPVKQPDQEKLRRQRGDRELESFDTQARQAEQDADAGGEKS